MSTNYRQDRDTTGVRTLFCIGILQNFFDAEDVERSELIAAFVKAFSNLDRFGVEVLGTFDDDNLMVGASTEWPWTAYILAHAPDLDSVAAVCNVVRETEIGRYRLWRFVRIEARVGNPIFGGIDPRRALAGS